jgi:hypothetical protein
MKTIYSLFSLSFAIILLSGCTKILNDFEFEDKDPKIVVQAKFSPDTAAWIFLTRSLDMYDRRQINPITEASVKLFRGEENMATFDNEGDGWYSVNREYLIPGNNYRLEVESERYPKATSEFTIPILPEIDRIDTTKIREIDISYSNMPTTKGKLTLHFRDNPATEDYYVVSLRKQSPQYIYDNNYQIIDTTYYYTYSYITSKSPYLELAYEPLTGYIKPVPDNSWLMKRLLFSDELFNGSDDVSFDIEFRPEYYGNINVNDSTIKDSIEVFFSSVDKNLYQYAKTKAEMNSSEGNPLAEPVTPFSNVTDGYGLVYGLSEKRYLIDLTGLFSWEDYGYYYYYY